MPRAPSTFKFKFPKTLEVADYLPKTQLGSELATPLEVGQRAGERTAKVTSLEGGANVGFKVFGVDVGLGGSGSSKEENIRESSSDVHFNLLPPKKTIVAAGTEDNGQTVSFELRPYSQATLKGQREFVFLLITDTTWTGDCFSCECSAKLSRDGIPTTLSRTFNRALYKQSDIASRRKQEMVSSQHTTDAMNASERLKFTKCTYYFTDSSGKDTPIRFTDNNKCSIYGHVDGKNIGDILTYEWSGHVQIDNNILYCDGRLEVSRIKAFVKKSLDSSGELYNLTQLDKTYTHPVCYFNDEIVSIQQNGRIITLASGLVLRKFQLEE
jgi:hypothetical protein